MSPALRLLDDVTWRGAPVPGERPAALLAALALSPSGVSDASLIEVVWAEERPANPTKALQVLVSRVRSQCGADVLVRQGNGYRLGLAHEDVDALLLGRLLQRAGAELSTGDPARAVTLAQEALELTAVDDEMAEGPLAELRSRARRTTIEARRLLGLSLARSGREREAVEHLRAVHEHACDDTEVLEALLRCEAVASGVPVALAHYEEYRRDLGDRLGVDPADSLKRLQRELLAADDPVRTGIRYDAEELLGREADLTRLRASVRSSRLTSIIGPGGMGKTRIAHVLAREATQSRVHFVELVGISSPDDVVPEVGAALGVRDSVTSRRTHTLAQRTDIRGRIAQELDSGPTLLVLDNCEHVVEAVASLVAFLLVTARDLRVVTTSRAPLNIAAERVVLLDQLSAEDGAALFVRRARAARPTADLDPELVDDVVARLDGLPLAIELAAARMRSMSLEELRQRLEDRFALLRGKDRSAPVRHQTLTAVIAWSWDLLGPREREALSWLSVFHDGVGIGAAEAVLGPDAMDLVESLVDQSLLSVTEADGSVRYRMLETVREFGTLRLAEAGQTEKALAAQSDWAVTLCASLDVDLFSSGQVTAVDQLTREENNLADVLRRAMGDDDADVAVPLMATLGVLWSITGNNPRVFALLDGAERLLAEWTPPPHLVEPAQVAVAIVVSHMGFFQDRNLESMIATMERFGVPDQPWARASYAMFVEADDGDRLGAVLKVADSPDPGTATMALQWAAVLTENLGDVDAARTYTERALAVLDDTTPWPRAMLHTQMALLAMQVGDPVTSVEHAAIAWPLLVRLHAHDDAVQVRAGMAMAALMRGDIGECERILDEVRLMHHGPWFGGHTVQAATHAELALAKGDVEAGLAAYMVAVAEMAAISFPGMEASGMEPWSLLSSSAALVAHVRYAETPAHLADRDRLALELIDRGRRLVALADSFLDYPVAGMMLAGLGAWVLDTGRADADLGVRLLVMAKRFSYNQTFPVMAWEPLAEMAERARPGRLAALLEEYDGRPGRSLTGEVADLLAQVQDSLRPSS